MSSADRDIRPRIWAIIRQIGSKCEVFNTTGVRYCLRFPVKRARVLAYLKALERGGYLAPVSAEHERGPGWQLIRNPGIDAPRLRDDGTEVVQGSGRDQCWRAMRILGTFTATELVATASTERWRVKPGEAEDYCNRLSRAGILSRAWILSSRTWCYTLSPARYTGPKPPQILRYKPAQDGQPARRKGVYDPNTGTLYWPDGRVERGVTR